MMMIVEWGYRLSSLVCEQKIGRPPTVFTEERKVEGNSSVFFVRH